MYVAGDGLGGKPAFTGGTPDARGVICHEKGPDLRLFEQIQKAAGKIGGEGGKLRAGAQLCRPQAGEGDAPLHFEREGGGGGKLFFRAFGRGKGVGNGAERGFLFFFAEGAADGGLFGAYARKAGEGGSLLQQGGVCQDHVGRGERIALPRGRGERRKQPFRRRIGGDEKGKSAA